MSIRTLIADRIAGGRLVQLPHMLLGLRTPRVIYLVSDLFRDLVQGPWADEETEFQMGTLGADLDRFLEGLPIVVGYRRARHAYMKRLDPGRDEIWAIRSRDPKPEYRVFGRFAETDVFIGTKCLDRDYLGNEKSRQWRDEMVRCATDWNSLFSPYPPLIDRQLHEYISTNVIDHRSLVGSPSRRRKSGLRPRPCEK